MFPLGMYAVATYKLSLASDFRPIELFSEIMVWFALGAWAVTTLGLARWAVRQARDATRASAAGARASSRAC